MVVADGMGAHAAGELASRIAADNIPLAYQKRSDCPPCEAIVAAVQDANGRIYAKGQNSVDFHGMGTTCSCLLLLPEGAMAAHVGDSRIYRIRRGVIEQLTFDHSLVWEMGAAGSATEDEVPAYVPRNVITRSLGPHPEVKVDLEGPLPIEAGDRYLLCSDGLTGPLNPELIGLVVGALPPSEAAQTLVDLSNLLGGPDNISVIVAEVDETAASTTESVSAAAARASACHPPPKERQRDWRSPALQVVAGTAGIGAAVLHALGHTAAAVACLGVGCVALAMWAWSLFAKPGPDASNGVTGPHGKGPYRRREVVASHDSIETLSDIVRQLENLEGQRDWQFDWSAIHEDRAQAHQAIARGDFQAAIVAYASAVRRLMRALRESGPPPTSDSTINLGED